MSFCRTTAAPRLMFLGAMGSGKSTALLAAKRALAGEGRSAHYVSIDALFDRGGARPGAMIALVGLAMIQALRVRDAVLSPAQRPAALMFHRCLKGRPGDSEFVDRTMLGPDVGDSPEILRSHLDHVVDAWSESRTRGAPPIVLLIDALDRRRWAEFEDAVLPDLALLNGVDVGLVIAGSTTWRGGIDDDVKRGFHDLWISPPPDPQDDGHRAFLRQLLAVRDQGALTEAVRDQIARFSGGVPRDLLRLADTTVRLALAEHGEAVQLAHVGRAVAVTRDNSLRLLPSTLRGMFEKWMRDPTVLREADFEALRARGCVIERDGAWLIHPMFGTPPSAGEAV